MKNILHSLIENSCNFHGLSFTDKIESNTLKSKYKLKHWFLSVSKKGKLFYGCSMENHLGEIPINNKTKAIDIARFDFIIQCILIKTSNNLHRDLCQIESLRKKRDCILVSPKSLLEIIESSFRLVGATTEEYINIDELNEYADDKKYIRLYYLTVKKEGKKICVHSINLSDIESLDKELILEKGRERFIIHCILNIFNSFSNIYHIF